MAELMSVVWEVSAGFGEYSGRPRVKNSSLWRAGKLILRQLAGWSVTATSFCRALSELFRRVAGGLVAQFYAARWAGLDTFLCRAGGGTTGGRDSPHSPLPIPVGLGYFHLASPRIISNWGTDGGQNGADKRKKGQLSS
jgi:hypothetical protein